jgi:hypothetical protein
MPNIKEKLAQLTHTLQTYERAVYLAADGSSEQRQALANVRAAATDIAALTHPDREQEDADEEWPPL